VDAQLTELPLEDAACRRPLEMNQPGLGDVLLLKGLIVRLPMLMWGALIRVFSIVGALRRHCRWRVCLVDAPGTLESNSSTLSASPAVANSIRTDIFVGAIAWLMHRVHLSPTQVL
jgi:hypothetical protein